MVWSMLLSTGMEHKTIWETRTERQSDDDRLAERFSRRETERQRQARVARKAVDPETAAALRRLWGNR